MKYYRQVCKDCKIKFKIYYDEIHRDQCEPCIEAEFNRQENTKSIKLIAENLNPENREKFLAMEESEQLYIVAKAWQDNILSYRFGKPTKARQ